MPAPAQPSGQPPSTGTDTNAPGSTSNKAILDQSASNSSLGGRGGRVARSTAFFRGRIGTMLNAQTSFANKLTVISNISKEAQSMEAQNQHNHSSDKEKEKESDESDSESSEDDNDNRSNSSSSSSGSSSDSPRSHSAESRDIIGNRGSLLAKRGTLGAKKTPNPGIRRTLLSSAQTAVRSMLIGPSAEVTASSGGAAGGSGSRGSTTGRGAKSTGPVRSTFLAGLGHQIRKTVARVTGAGGQIGSLRRKQKKATDALIQPKFHCVLNDETIRIPGCHGNSVVKFDFLDGE